MDIQTKIILTGTDLQQIVEDHLKRNGQAILSFSLDGSCSHSHCLPRATVTVKPSDKLLKLKDVSDSDES